MLGASAAILDFRHEATPYWPIHNSLSTSIILTLPYATSKNWGCMAA
jgi:hypothetical protein